MTAAPNNRLVEKVAVEIEKLGVSETDAADFAEAAIAACHVDELREVLRECADDLQAELYARYALNGEVHPAQQRRYVRDMEPVIRARALLAKLDGLP